MTKKDATTHPSISDYVDRLKNMRHEMYTNDRTLDGDAINWALGHVEESIKEILYEQRFDINKDTKEWIAYIPEEVPSQMKLWLCRYIQKAADKKPFGLNSVQQRKDFAYQQCQELGVFP